MFWITGLLGLVLAVSPFVLGYSDIPGALWTNIVLGAFIFAVSVIAVLYAGSRRWPGWVIGLAGVAAVIAPFIFGYSDVALPLWTTIALGAVLIILDAIAVLQPPTAPAR